jgi:hypothetical protein
MSKRVLIVVSLVSALSLLSVPAAAAYGPQWGRGSLVANGDGIASLRGEGRIDLAGNGVLWVRAGPDAVVEVSGYGHKQVFPDGWQQYAGFNGTAHIVAGRMHTVVTGVGIHLEATGRWSVLLWGHGSYQWNSQSGSWGNGDQGTNLEITES